MVGVFCFNLFVYHSLIATQASWKIFFPVWYAHTSIFATTTSPGPGFFSPKSTKQALTFINITVDSKRFDRRGGRKANSLPTHWGPSSQGLSYSNLITGNSFLNCLLLCAPWLNWSIWSSGSGAGRGTARLKQHWPFQSFQIISYLPTLCLTQLDPDKRKRLIVRNL